jgi:hypothetical protein
MEYGYCRKMKTGPKLPQMDDLPDFRLTVYSPTFRYTEFDFFGTLLIKIGKRQEKRWCAIFTCLNSQTIHIELAASLSTDSAIMAVRRFRGRRGDVK